MNDEKPPKAKKKAAGWQAPVAALGALAATGAAVGEIADRVDIHRYEQAALQNREDVHEDGRVVHIEQPRQVVSVVRDEAEGTTRSVVEDRVRVRVVLAGGMEIEGDVPASLTQGIFGLEVGDEVDVGYSERHYPNEVVRSIDSLAKLGPEV